MLTADTITVTDIEALRDRSCECRDERGNKPPIESPDEHAGCHDCDVEIYDTCVVALEAVDEEAMTARVRCAEILNEREARR